MSEVKVIPRSYFLHDKVTEIAEDLLGKVLCTYIDEKVCKGVIIETEAYSGYNDKACHAYNGKRTSRTEIFFKQGGLAYVYLCYGIHYLFNVITNSEEIGDAVLIRALEPITGADFMFNRIGKIDKRICSGPGKLTKALGISGNHNGLEIPSNSIWFEDHSREINNIEHSKRIGVDYAGEDALKLWRFSIKNHPLVSK